MKLTGMADSLGADDDSAFQEMGLYDRLGLMVDREFNKTHSRLQRLVSRAVPEYNRLRRDIRYDDDRRLTAVSSELASCNIPHARNVLVIDRPERQVLLAQALGQAACRHMLTTRYVQLPDLLDELKIAKRRDLEAFNRLRKQIVKFDLLIIDEWLLFPISEEDSEILLSIIDRRHNYKATIVASQYEPAEWLDQIPTAVVAEAITDRLASQAYRIIIRGSKSMRETIRK